MLNPRVDFAFKKLFGSESSKDILIDFINSIIDKKDHIQDLILKNPYNEKEFKTAKQSILDIKAQAISGEWFNIEMQVKLEDYYAKRTLYYWAKIYTEQLNEKENYDLLNRTICINILNFNHLSSPDYHNVYYVKHSKYDEILTNALEIHFIELKKYQDDEFQNTLDRWVHFLKKAERYENNQLPDALKEIPAISKAYDILNAISMSAEERQIYELALKNYRDEYMILNHAELKGFNQGFKQGEYKKAIETAESLIKLNLLSIEQICETTQLTLEDLKQHQLI